MGIMILASISLTNYGLAKIICALEISEYIRNLRPMTFCWSCAISKLVNLQA